MAKIKEGEGKMEDYFKKYEENVFRDLEWNIPEQKQGTIAIIGGNAQSFRTEVKLSEFLQEKYPLKEVKNVLPDALKGKIPDLPNFVFVKSTESGSLASAEEIERVAGMADYDVVLGDLSKNTITLQALQDACKDIARPFIITRDAVDAVAVDGVEELLYNENLAVMGSVAQLVKLLRAAYYPKMLMMTQSLVQVVEVLHKFTLSYPVKVATLHLGQILVAADGKVAAVPMEKSGYSMLTFWGGELAGKIAVMNLYSPGKFVEASVAAIFQ